MLALTNRDAPFRSFDIARVGNLLEQARNRHRAKRAVFAVLREIWITLKEAFYFGLPSETSAGVSFQGFTHTGRQRFVGYKHLATTALGGNLPLNAPDYLAWHVTQKGDKAYWNKVGAAWKHKDERGFTLQLETCPINGRIVLRLPLEDAPETANDAGRS